MRWSYIPVPVDMRDAKRMAGPDTYVCNDTWGTCVADHKHPYRLIRVPVLLGELVAGDPTMDGVGLVG